MVTVEFEPTFERWQAAARALLSEGISPADVEWRERPDAPPAPRASKFFRVPPRFLELARQAATPSDPTRWGAIYSTTAAIRPFAAFTASPRRGAARPSRPSARKCFGSRPRAAAPPRSCRPTPI